MIPTRTFALAVAATPLAAQAPQTGTSPARAPVAAPTAAKLLDINTATASELDALPGIGPARAEAIVKGRPYKGKDDLLRRKILPSNVYDGIKDRIIARQA